MTHTVEAAGTDQYLDFQSTSSSGKYALLMVPDYDTRDTAPGNQTSYFLLGAAPAITGLGAWGNWLGSTMGTREHTQGDRVGTTQGTKIEVVGGNYELHVRGTANAPTAYGTAPEQLAFRNADEAYLRAGRHDGRPHLPSWLDSDDTKKKEVEAVLDEMVKGEKFAWEDHAYGHRITTTSGDKIEIIKGKNYVHVLGADDFDVHEGKLMISRTGPNPQVAGYNATNDQTEKKPFLVSRSWVQRSIEEKWFGKTRDAPNSKLPLDANVVRDGHTNEVPDGHSYSYTYAHTLKSVVGDDTAVEVYDEAATIAAAAIGVNTVVGLKTFPNRVELVEERTYAKKIESYTGSSDCWVDDIKEDTHAHTINTFTTADGINDVTMVKGGMAETKLVPIHTETQVSVLHNEVHVGAHTSFEAGFKFEFFVGGHIEIAGPEKGKKEIVLAETKKVSPEDVEASLKKVTTALEKMSTSVSEKTVTMRAAITALKVDLGSA